jgi:hypothetical protein
MFDSDVIVFRVISGTYENWMGKLRRRSVYVLEYVCRHD